MGQAQNRVRRREKVETALIVGLASLVAIKGFGALSGVLAGLGGMVRDLLALLTS